MALLLPMNIIQDIINRINTLRGSNVEIMVTPQELYDTAQVLLTKISAVQGRIDSLNNTMKNIKGYWDGEKSDIRTSQFVRQIDQMSEIVRLLHSYVIKLQVIARNYIICEDENADSAGALPTNVIM